MVNVINKNQEDIMLSFLLLKNFNKLKKKNPFDNEIILSLIW